MTTNAKRQLDSAEKATDEEPLPKKLKLSKESSAEDQTTATPSPQKAAATVPTSPATPATSKRGEETASASRSSFFNFGGGSSLSGWGTSFSAKEGDDGGGFLSKTASPSGATGPLFPKFSFDAKPPEDSKTKPKFVMAGVEEDSGDSDETVYFKTNVKLFQLSGKKYNERGVGLLKLNYKKDAAEDKKKLGRLLCRRNGTRTVMLNVAVDGEMRFEKAGSFVRFCASIPAAQGSSEEEGGAETGAPTIETFLLKNVDKEGDLLGELLKFQKMFQKEQ